MTDQFRNYDAPKRPQVVTIEWERVLKDDDTAGRPDERDDAFWPVSDDFEGDEKAYLDARGRAQERLDEFDAEQWWYVGVIARAHVAIPIGGGSFATYTMDSPGLWGIESDSEESYLAETFEDAKAEILAHLETLADYMTAQRTAPGSKPLA